MKGYPIVILFICTAFSCSQEQNTYIHDEKERISRLIEDLPLNKNSDIRTKRYGVSNGIQLDVVENILSEFDTVTIDGEVRYLGEGDLLFTKEQLLSFVDTRQKTDQVFKWLNQPFLVILADGNKKVKLKNPGLVKFGIEKSTFSDDQYNDIVELFKQAVKSWNGACGVNFIHEPHWDSSLDKISHPEELFFIVRKNAAAKDYLASAPFPNWGINERVMRIDPAFFGNTIFDKSGILRHELGHVMGFLHEEIQQKPAPKCALLTIDPHFSLSQFDPNSVMHFFCGEKDFGNPELLLTYLDSTNALKEYPK